MLRRSDRAGFLAFVLMLGLAIGSRQPGGGFSVRVGRFDVPSPPALSVPEVNTAGVLLHTPLDDAASITHPSVGIGGATTLLGPDFVPAYLGNGARFAGAGKVVIFPSADSNAQNIALDRGEVEFWYRPAYDAATDDIGHYLLVVGDVYNVPSLILAESDRLSLSLTDAGWNTYATQAGWRAPLWSAGQWVHLRATWDATAADPLRLFVNGVRVDEGSADTGWNLGPETAIGDIFVGAGDAAGDFTADGVIDELIIRDAPQLTATATPTATPTSDGAAPTATPTPAGIGLTDPDMIVTPAPLPLQPVGTPFVDPVFGTTLRRVSNTSASGGFETHIYSQLQAFSADNAYLLLDGSAGFVVRRVSDLSLVAGLDTSEWNVPRWHPTRSHTLIHFDSNADTVIRLQFTDVDTLVTTTVFTFPAQYERIRVNQSFDEVSEDGRWLAGMVSRDDGVQVIFALDLQNLTLGAQVPIPGLYAGPCESGPQWPEAEPDWIGVSPLGNYLVVQWARDGTARCSGLETFDLQTGDFIGRVYDGHQHGDLGVDSDGTTEFFMTFEMAAPPPDNDRPALGVRTLPGTSSVSAPAYVQVLDWGNGEHISCRGPNGVCLVTASTWDINGWNPFEGELFLQYTDGRVLRLVHHRSSDCGYWVQPRASISRDGRYVVFASDWGQETGTDSCGSGNSLGGGDPYIIDLLAGSSDLPTACSPDADGNGFINILDIQARASDATCLTYLPLIASYWHQTWPAAPP